MCLSGRDEQGIYPKREREREKERELFNEDNRAQSDSAEIALSVQEQKPGRQPQLVHFFLPHSLLHWSPLFRKRLAQLQRIVSLEI